MDIRECFPDQFGALAERLRERIPAVGEQRVCPRCGRDYRYHGLIVCDSCHAAVNAAEAE